MTINNMITVKLTHNQQGNCPVCHAQTLKVFGLFVGITLMCTTCNFTATVQQWGKLPTNQI